MTRHDGLQPGFSDPAVDAAQAFRAIMRAMARPGTIETVSHMAPPAPLSAAAGAVLLTLCDAETPLCLAGAADCEAVRTWITFHTGAPFREAAQCSFALGPWAALTPLSAYPVGTSDYPDRSATLIVETPDLAPHGAVLRGPGIEEEAHLSLPETAAFRHNAAQFPRGLDCIFTCGDRVAALPRTTRVEGA
ncbi:phosphonate C-P lyase system protein PhnH [Roseovarius sp. D22-M7]|uniref:phosphonate C-P lyase system protein PhnH n=1 Tax=Roseovarius sp. D22-M7 TaxID=3127116 RepID=UPI00300FDC92